MVELKNIHSPDDVKHLNRKELPELCKQLRQKMIETVAQNGGHLSSNLGTVELTVALHRAFTTPHDAIVWDVGHQCYAHKLLTDRYDAFDTLRQKDGVSGFPKPSESRHDAFVTGHSSTAISAANGIAKAKELSGDDGYTVAVIGDGALTGGLAYEGLCNAGRGNNRLIVILNDNKMSISRNVGFVARYLAHLRVKVRYLHWKQSLSNLLSHIPLVGRPTNTFLKDCKKRMKRSLFASTSFFENMGFHYMGPVDGHNLDDLIQALEAAKSIDQPVVLHIATVKGKGYSYAEKAPDIYHGISGFDAATGQVGAAKPSFSSVFGETLCNLAEQDGRIVAVTAAMVHGTCLGEFAGRYPERFFDTGITEEHAVTFSSGMACGGLLPVFAVYSTFLQRSLDQLINDTSIMNNHIVLAIDRAGIVPNDGETHQGIYDIAMLRAVPHTTVYAPSNYAEMRLHLSQALYDVDGIAAVRYPKGAEASILEDYPASYQPFDYIDHHKRDTVIITYGRTFAAVMEATEKGKTASIIKLNRIIPIDHAVLPILLSYECVLIFEETFANNGIGEWIGEMLMERRYGGSFRVCGLTDTPGACTTDQGLSDAGLDAQGIRDAIRHMTEENDG